MVTEALNILHVEDDDTDAYLMQELMNEYYQGDRFTVWRANSLNMALKMIRKHGFDAVLLDMNLQDICGIDNVLAIKEENPDVPVVVLSGVDNDTLALETIDRGAQEYLVKGHCNGRII